MASFARHRENGQRELGDGCGRLMWLAWGGDAGVDWAIRKMDQLEKERLSRELCSNDILSQEIQDQLIEKLSATGITDDTLKQDNFKIVYEEDYDGKDKFALPTRASANPSAYTNEIQGDFKILYKYKGPKDSKNRDFCQRLLSLDLLFRKEDIQRMTVTGANSQQFGFYDIFQYKGSYGCRHRWTKTFVYRRRDVGADNILPDSMSKMKFSADNDQQMIVGPLVIPNKLILRVDENNEPYYVYFSEDTTKAIGEKLMRNKFTDRINLEHDPDKPVRGYLNSIWTVDNPEYDKQVLFGMNYPKGTLMGQYKIEDKDVFERIKNGEFKAFSIEGFFNNVKKQG